MAQIDSELLKEMELFVDFVRDEQEQAHATLDNVLEVILRDFLKAPKKDVKDFREYKKRIKQAR